ncbi:MAG: tRNA (cytidine(56)-2'-O)-methyltransferase [Thermoplasmata archaeon]|nr:tRNA (cytidine(56)-2'-O)-methyltransferase [Thermoplasmata archaeon]
MALTARALGAERLYLHPPDSGLAERLASVGRRFGGRFEVVGAPDWKAVVRAFDGPVVHLTMYGEPLDAVVGRLRNARQVLAVVGGAKVPPDLYRMATVNAAAGHQPHSEVAALALLLDRLRGIPPPGRWPGARQEIVPSARGKTVRNFGREEPRP